MQFLDQINQLLRCSFQRAIMGFLELKSQRRSHSVKVLINNVSGQLLFFILLLSSVSFSPRTRQMRICSDSSLCYLLLAIGLNMIWLPKLVFFLSPLVGSSSSLPPPIHWTLQECPQPPSGSSRRWCLSPYSLGSIGWGTQEGSYQLFPPTRLLDDRSLRN